jgi:hypothetical protein
MKFMLLQIGMHLTVIFMHFLTLFQINSNEIIEPIQGFNALIHPQFFGIGNLFIWFILIGSVLQVITRLGLIFFKEKLTKKQLSLITITNIQLFSGLIIATLLGTYLTMIGVLMISIIAISTFIYYKHTV